MNPSLTAAVIANDLINRVKAMQTFEVTQDMPEDFAFNGEVPFDIVIRDGKITCSVLAISLEQAVDMVDRWVAQRTQGDE